MTVVINGSTGITTPSPVVLEGSTSGTTDAFVELKSNTQSSFYYNYIITKDQTSNSINWAIGYAAPAGTLTFSTNGVTERMRIDSSGNLLVGQTTLSATTVGFGVNPAGLVNIAQNNSTSGGTGIQIYSTAAAAFRFFVTMDGRVNATNTTILAISDARLKENIQDIDVGLDAVMALKPRKFDWKEGKGKDIKGDRGWIAQEFEQVFPEMVGTWRDEPPEGEEPYKSVGADLIPVLVKAIQEQQQMIETLQAKVAALEAK